MNRIKKLLQEHCPDGVEYKELKDIGFLYGGLTGKSKNDFKDGNAKFITYMNVFSNIAVNTDIDTFVKIRVNERQNLVVYGDILFTASSETPDECGMSSVLTERIEEPLYLNSFCFGFRLSEKELFLPDFLKYLFRDEGIRKQINKTANGVTRFNISKKLFERIKVPVPPLLIQQEIVNILDKFIQLEEELSYELEARRKQYEYYRDKLLMFREINCEGGVNICILDNCVSWRKLGEICLSVDKVNWKGNINKEFHYIDLSSVNRENNRITETQIINSETAPSRAQQIVKKYDIVFGTTRPTLKRHSFIISKYDEQICSTGFCVLRADKNHILPKYVFYSITTTEFYNYIEKNQEGAGYPSISDKKVKEYQLCIPPLSVQERIISILDKFDALVNDTSYGIPAEIEARRKQYEYYRDKLLTFEELESIV